MLGTVDPEFLNEDRELGIPTGGQFWCRNIIKGVTDIIPQGKKFLEGSALGTEWKPDEDYN